MRFVRAPAPDRAKAMGVVWAQDFATAAELRVLRDDPDGDRSKTIVSGSYSHTYWEEENWRRAFIEGAVSVLNESEDE